jgi:hypothetical protein
MIGVIDNIKENFIFESAAQFDDFSQMAQDVLNQDDYPSI